ncbi:sialidase family protein [Propionibacteriaceae bacterium Y1700]|uniref:sialidase family protein n=1 Tax=Microlunatus sp. Y1700 TaxID=3418487 RepID=UPI003DA71238
MSATISIESTVFAGGDEGYHSFRIPAVLSLGDDRVLAFCEGRLESPDDAGQIDLVVRTSDDGGRTWGPLRVVSSADGYTSGNPAPVVDPASGDIVLLSCRNIGDVKEREVTISASGRNTRTVHLQRSSDRGDTWSAPVDISEQAKPEGWGWYATGPGHGIALTDPRWAGRLVVPGNHSMVPTAEPDRELHTYGGAHSLISDDGGHTWRVGFVDRNDADEINANENMVAELADGRLHFNARNHEGTLATRGGPRVAAWSSDGGETLDAVYAPATGIVSPIIQGSLLRWRDRLLLSAPSDPDRRRLMMINSSVDDGRTWQQAWQVSDAMAGYSDLVAMPDGSVGLLYETGEKSSFAELRFVTFTLADEAEVPENADLGAAEVAS